MASLAYTVANGATSAATYTASVVPVLLTGTAAAAGAAAKAVAGSRTGKAVGHAAKGVAGVVGGAAAGALAASTTGVVALNAVGFTAIGPAAGSFASAWMSSIATANGVGVLTGSVYSVVQGTAMSGGLLIGSPLVLGAGAAAGALAWSRWR